MGKYGPEKTSYLNTYDAVKSIQFKKEIHFFFLNIPKKSAGKLKSEGHILEGVRLFFSIKWFLNF